MTKENLKYIENVKVEDIPWHRITTTYKRATDFPECFEILNEMKDKKSIETAGELNISLHCGMQHLLPVYSYTESLKRL